MLVYVVSFPDPHDVTVTSCGSGDVTNGIRSHFNLYKAVNEQSRMVLLLVPSTKFFGVL